ncbi:MAG TPA: efflux RND transporter periplasmic adaptor subunit [Coxiellaceae bacterium]|nr:MAG: hypothetical protein A3E81_04200 [Gammaproteobacteria bacterium RIFCSPHIGHO2_12_FULL_36_30]HLB56043.1 efflux RND transporter periplasmic adaptor subunit [Coxiellaceae bacterium]
MKTLIIILLSCIFLTANCYAENKDKKAEKLQTVIAQLQTPVRKLYFTGTLSPIQTVPVISPVAGNIEKTYFSYGERIQTGQKLFLLESQPLGESFRKAVKAYISAKQAYATEKTKFEGTAALYKAGVTAKDDYTAEQTQYENDKLAFSESQYALKKVLNTAKIHYKKIEDLSLSETSEIEKVLETHFHHIEINAPHEGVALFPIPTKSSDGSTSSGKLSVGDSVKEGQLLLAIGDLSGLSASFDVSEVDIDRIKKNMDVIVTGSAFPGLSLKGVITSVSVQANLNSGESGLSMFSVKIDVPHIDPNIMKKIRVGMTAKFEIDIKSSPRIMLPVNAVTEKNGVSVVTILDAQGKTKTVPVVTGDTTPIDVVIISGIKVGDKVVIPTSVNTDIKKNDKAR